MFIENDDTIDIVLFYRKVAKSYIVFGEKDFQDNVKEKSDQDKYKKLTVKMKILTWGLFNELQDIATVTDPNTMRNVFNYKIYKEEKLKRLIVSWDATVIKGDKTISVPVTSETVLKLAPAIAETLLALYDSISTIEEEEEKK